MTDHEDRFKDVLPRLAMVRALENDRIDDHDFALCLIFHGARLLADTIGPLAAIQGLEMIASRLVATDKETLAAEIDAIKTSGSA